MVPSFDGGDDPVGIAGPCERFGVFVGLGDEAVDGDLPVRRMIASVPSPSALKRMMAARHTCF